jgi:hypothetical protein
METILLHSLTIEEFRLIIREELKLALQQDQLLTKEGAQKLIGASNAVFLKAVEEGKLKPQFLKGRKKAMYYESDVLKVAVTKRNR